MKLGWAFLWLSRNLVWVYSIFNWKDWISSKTLLALFFACHNILRQSSTLIVHLHSVSSLFFIYFRRAKVAKRPAETKSVVCSFCSRVALQHPSAVTNLPLQSFLLFVGCCGSHCVRQFLRNIIAVLRLDVPHTMAAKQQGFPL